MSTSAPHTSAACTRVQSMLEAYHDDELARRDHEHVTDHLAGCEHCVAALAPLTAMRGALRTVVEAEMADDPTAPLWNRIAGALENEPAVPAPAAARPWARLLRPALVFATAAGVVLVMLFARNDPPPERTEVALDSFMVESVDVGDGGVLVYETGETAMTIIWVLDDEVAS